MMRDGDAVLQLARDVLADLDLELVLERALDAARALTGARYAALGILDADRRELARFLTTGIDPEQAAEIGPLPRGRGVLGELIRDPEPLRLEDVESHPHAYGFPPAHPSMHTFLGVPIVVGGEAYGNLYLAEKEGGIGFDDDDEAASVRIAEFAGLAIDHARRCERVVARERAARRAADSLQAAMAIAQTLAGLTDLEAILDLVVKRARALVSARGLFAELVEGDCLYVAAVAGEMSPDLCGVRIEPDESVAADALRTRLADRPRPDRSPTAGYGDQRVGFGFGEALAVPLLLRDTAHGALVALDRETEDQGFTEGDEALLTAFATGAVGAIVTVRAVGDEDGGRVGSHGGPGL